MPRVELVVLLSLLGPALLFAQECDGGGEEGVFSAERRTRRLGHEPHGLVLGDIDADGSLDAVTSNGGCLSYSTLLGEGDGNLRVATTVPVAGELISTALGDFDRDGDLDVAFAEFEGNVRVGLGDGGGRFSALASFAVGRTPSYVTAADLDGDGDLDVVTADPTSTGLTLLFNDGTASFDERRRLRTAIGPRAAVTVDFDADGDLDLAAVNASARAGLRLSMHRQAGDGTFAEGEYYAINAAPFFLTAGDFDGDGHSDVVTVQAGGRFSLLRNRGDGSFQAGAQRELAETAAHVLGVDLDGDADLDLVTANPPHNSVSVLVNDTGGGFSAPLRFATGGDPRSVVSGDLDGDGRADLVSADHDSKGLTILFNRFRAAGGGDFLESICSAADFQKLSAAGDVGGSAGRLLHFTLPARDDASLLPLVFQDTERYPRHEDFLAAVFPERFGALTALDFERLALRRVTREYFAGSLLTLCASETGFNYGFSVRAISSSDPLETLTLEEVRRVHTVLAEAFLLGPIVYIPDTDEAFAAARTWADAEFPLLLGGAGDGAPGRAPTFELQIPPGTVACGVFVSGRSPREEYTLKSQVVLAAGSLALPTDRESFERNLIESLTFGPRLQPATALGSGVFRLSKSAACGAESIYSYEYQEEFVLDSDARLTVIFSDLEFRQEGADAIARPLVIDDEFLSRTLRLTVDPLHELSRLTGELSGALPEDEFFLRYSSCTHASLPLWLLETELDDGLTLRLEERFLEEFVLVDTVPASLVRAEVAFRDERRVIADYQSLVYSAARHNTDVHYWLLLAPALVIEGLPAPVYAIEYVGRDSRTTPSANYLDRNFEVIARRRVLADKKTKVSRNLVFLRGDVNADGGRNLADVLSLLKHLFGRAAAPPCSKAADADDSGSLNLLDALSILFHLFRGGGRLAEPATECGLDPSEDALDCNRFTACP